MCVEFSSINGVLGVTDSRFEAILFLLKPGPKQVQYGSTHQEKQITHSLKRTTNLKLAHRILY